MIEISLNKVNKNYGFKNILNNLSFDIKTNEKVALIGSNGCGKTTVLKLIMGLTSIDSGSINVRRNSTIGYLSQVPDIEEENVKGLDVYLRGVSELIELEKNINEYINTMDSDQKSINILGKMQEEFRIKGGYILKEKIEKIKHGFKLSETVLKNKYNDLSGGEKTIIRLASLVLSSPDILLLDEPTNHLDIEALEWFEDYLKSYNGTVIIVSHDRYFLDKVINKIICIENGHEDIYFGNYSYYLEESEKRLLIEFQSYKNQQRKIKAMKEAIARLKLWGTKSDNPMFFRRANAMQTRLDKMEKVEKPVSKESLKINLTSSFRSANHVLDINNLDLKIGTKELLKNSRMAVNFKDRVCLMGKNGCGKTTLIKAIMNNNTNEISIGNNVLIGYIPQEINFDNEELTIYEYMRNIFVGSEAELRSKLHKFYFESESLDKKLKNISGGERVRIKLLELILKKANFLILDEPTNHIDIDTREILESSLLEFDGTILFISHDRYFINKIATKIIRIENNSLISYDGNYDYYKSIVDKLNNRKEEIKEVKKEIKIEGSNRLKEFIKDANKIEEISIGCNSKVYKVTKKSKVFFIKIANHLSKESMKLDYLNGKLNVPEKVFYEKYNNLSYLVTKEIKGQMLCSPYYMNHPLEGIDILVSAFNELYSIDYSDCFFDETIDSKIKDIEERFSKIDDKKIKKEIIDRFHTKENILKYLKGNKPKQIIGFTHGDMSLPNIFALNNKFNGFIDVADCGLCDIYFDLVICEMSIERNYGKEYINAFYDKLGIEKDEFKSDYYRILMSL